MSIHDDSIYCGSTDTIDFAVGCLINSRLENIDCVWEDCSVKRKRVEKNSEKLFKLLKFTRDGRITHFESDMWIQLEHLNNSLKVPEYNALLDDPRKTYALFSYIQHYSNDHTPSQDPTGYINLPDNYLDQFKEKAKDILLYKDRKELIVKTLTLFRSFGTTVYEKELYRSFDLFYSKILTNRKKLTFLNRITDEDFSWLQKEFNKKRTTCLQMQGFYAVKDIICSDIENLKIIIQGFFDVDLKKAQSTLFYQNLSAACSTHRYRKNKKNLVPFNTHMDRSTNTAYKSISLKLGMNKEDTLRQIVRIAAEKLLTKK